MTESLKEITNSWKKVIWIHVIEIVVLCVVPVELIDYSIFPGMGWGVAGAFYQFGGQFDIVEWPYIAAAPTLFLLVVTLSMLILNLWTRHRVLHRGNSGQIPLAHAKQFLQVGLYLPFISYCIFLGSMFVSAGFQIAAYYMLIPLGSIVILLLSGLRLLSTRLILDNLLNIGYMGPLDESWVAPVRKTILELGTKFTRLQLNEIAEMCGLSDEEKIVAVIEDMIRRNQIVAQYFKSSRSVAFDQQANTQALAKFINELDGQFSTWGENGKKTEI